MTKISLRAYNREIEDLVEQGQRLDEAVAHCLHILKAYPKHLETYRLLGKAYLEAKRYEQAVDIFQRVLVAAPEDFVSHVGMSIIADDKANLDDAIWHMERAFEVQPSNAAIQAELQRLFGRRDGVEPPKIRLTRGALAHMYVQGELYTQAISEIRAVLGHDPNRTDMQVLLARAYARNGQKAEAAEVCSALLAISAYCLDANRLMAELTLGPEQTDASREYRRRVVELDPYAEFAKGSEFNSETVPDGAVMLERLEFAGTSAPLASPLGISLAGEAQSQRPADAIPSWLSSGPESTDEALAPEAERNDVPDFMREAGWRGTASGTADVPSELDDEAAAAPGELPEWVKALAPSEQLDEGSGTQSAPQDAADWSDEHVGAASGLADSGKAAGSGSGTLDWLRELGLGTENPPASPREAVEGEQTPPTETAPEVEVPLDRGGDGDDGLAWLEGLAEKHGAQPAELLTDPTKRPLSPPAWTQGAEDVPQAASAEDVPMDSQAVDRPLDWMSGLSDQNTFVGMEEQGEAEDRPILDEEDASRWPDPGQRPAVGEVPNWLSDSPVQSDGSSRGSDRSSSVASESAVDLPNWLAGLDGESTGPVASASRTSPRDELPDWLQSEDAAGPDTVAPDQTAWRAAQSDDVARQDDASSLGSMATPSAAGPAGESQATPEAPTPVPPPAPEPLPRVTKQVPDASRNVLPPLRGAQDELGRGNIAAALDLYGRLIRKGRSLEEIIRDLRDALYRYPVEVPIWQALGDAYMRANRLQEALDAYTKAEELLR